MAKVTMLVEREVEVNRVEIEVPVYPEKEYMPSNFPFIRGGIWNPRIDADTGQILNWPAGAKGRDLHMKVRDEGTYRCFQNDEEVHTTVEDYVPSYMPGNHYGDYVILDIDDSGKIKNWPEDFGAELQEVIDAERD